MVEPLNAPSFKRDRLREIEKEAQDLWVANKVNESEPDSNPKKLFVNYPLPEMNRKLLLGDAFTLSKCEFMIRHKRLKGYNTLWPISFHGSGLSITKAAEKLKREFEMFGEGIFEWADKQQDHLNKPKHKELNLSIVTKLRMIGIPDRQIHLFKDPNHWLTYYSQAAIKDLQSLGIMVDWRRSFLTTDINSYYDSFIKWQFHHLKEKGKILFVKKQTIWSPIDGQPINDYDRLKGEGVVPQEYTLIKLGCLELPGKLDILKDKKVFLVAATLRPETIYGPTNCFVFPTGKYGCFEMKNDEVWITSEQAARNMAYQGLTKVDESWNSILDVIGEDLIGLPLKAPLSFYDKIYVLPKLNLNMSKCTGISISVPSENPEDWIAFKDLKSNAEFRKKFKIKDEFVFPFDPVPIIEVDEVGIFIGIKACEQFGVERLSDKSKIETAKQFAYLKSYSQGKLAIGEFKGNNIAEVKATIKAKLINNGEACIYYEPEQEVVSRSGNVCVVKSKELWAIHYQDEDWKQKVNKHVNSANLSALQETALNQLKIAIDTLPDWVLSRDSGLGFRIPGDEKYLIDSLSDSTISTAYCTVAHLLQDGVEGSKTGLMNITPSQMTIDAWNYVLLNTDYKECPVPRDKLDVLKEQFRYYYPLNLTCLRKDFLSHHLPISLYNHALIWEKEPKMWPRAIWCNGFFETTEKVSQYPSHPLSIEKSIERYGADATRIILADAGDSLEDAYFSSSAADNAVLKLWQLELWIQEAATNFSKLRDANDDVQTNIKFVDTVFLSQLELTLANVDKAYETMQFREVLRHGFFELISLKEDYKIQCGENKMRKDIFLKYLETQLLVMYPIIPHFSEIMWRKYYLPCLPIGHDKPEFISHHRWPSADVQKIDFRAVRTDKYIKELYRTLRADFEKFNSRRKEKNSSISKIIIIFAPEYDSWQKKIIQFLSTCNITSNNTIEDWKKLLLENLGLDDHLRIKGLQFGAYFINRLKTEGKDALDINLPFNEGEIIVGHFQNFRNEFKAAEIELVNVEEAKASVNQKVSQIAETVLPEKPRAIFEC